MKRLIGIYLIMFTLLVMLFGSPNLSAAIPTTERAALIALYNATSGSSWKNRSGWKEGTLEADGFGAIGSEGSWYGITVENDHVKTIDLHTNSLSGTLPSELGALSSLENLLLYDNNISGSIPPELGNLSQLKIMSMRYNSLSGTIPAELGNLGQLTTMNFFGNQLTGSIPPELANLSQLKLLRFSFNRLNGGIPPELGNLSLLEDFLLNSNDLSGSIPVELANLGQLKTLYLSSNDLTGSIPSQFGNLSHLEQVTLAGNRLSGVIPPELGNLSQLNFLSLDNNSLSGTIPKELGSLSLLQSLRLSGNQLSGSIPPELGNLSQLELISLGSNPLTGTLPRELGNLKRLVTLWISNTRIGGIIPSEIGNLLKLRELSLSRNQLYGSIPLNFTNLTHLTPSQSSLDYNALYNKDETLGAFLSSHVGNWQDTQTIAPENISAVHLTGALIRVSWTPITYTGDAGAYNIYYSTTSGGPWTLAGKTVDKRASSYNVQGLTAETGYYFMITTESYPAYYMAQTIVSENSTEVYLAPGTAVEDNVVPFGSFDSPDDGSNAAGSIAVTGWALDNIGIDTVKIYRKQDNNLVYIGDATLVEGARPDVADLYSSYPDNTRAGWGYMLLTNFLPSGGNGTFILEAIASDYAGNETSLGTKIIICDNANAVKPFGAIDTPTQGGTVSAGLFVNWGWCLTPQPNAIALNGSSIDVLVDGVKVGQPHYNIYREDIATLFPGFANSAGAVGYFYLSNVSLKNGVHTIQWTVRDDAGNVDGIGSRYFIVQKNNGDSAQSGQAMVMKTDLSDIPKDYITALSVRKGYDDTAEPQQIHPDERGTVHIRLNQMQRLEILFPDEVSLVSPLPVGATMDVTGQSFKWQPGPASLGRIPLVFLLKNENGITVKKKTVITIVPKSNN